MQKPDLRSSFPRLTNNSRFSFLGRTLRFFSSLGNLVTRFIFLEILSYWLEEKMTLNELETSLKLPSLFEGCYDSKSGVPEFKILIDGKWRKSVGGNTIDVSSPIDGALVARVQSGVALDADAAVNSAYASRKKIRDIPAIDRINILNRARHIIQDNRELFVRTLVAEAGKTPESAQGEVRASLNRIKMTMEEARSIFGEYVPGDWSEDTVAKFALVIHEPLGVITCITPFNYPLFSLVAKVIPALVSGNSIVIKPATDDPLSSILLSRVLQESGIPEGVVNLVTGRGREVGDTLVGHRLVSMVTLTGSTETGRHVARMSAMKKLHLELGGKGSAVVADDADLTLASKKILEGALKFSGQRCDAISRVLPFEKIHEELVAQIMKDIIHWKLGDPRSEGITMGPLINEAAAERVQLLVDDAVSEGALLLQGGTHNGAYFQPTVLDNVSLEAKIAWEETFGPVVVFIPVKDLDEAIKIVNESPYGLDSCIFTESFYTAWKAAKSFEEGSVAINDAPAHGVGYFPFGGNKDSGLGREGVGHSIDEMTRLKTIQFNLAPAGLGKVRQQSRM
jgi:glyceraldehyde-3-phosphate dehydrogenase [NAD(P)+]